MSFILSTSVSVIAPAPGPNSTARIWSRESFWMTVRDASDIKYLTILATVLPSRRKFCPRDCFGLKDPDGREGVAVADVVD